MDAVSTLALALGSGWASGINLYAAILTLGVAGRLEVLKLPVNLEVLQSPLVLAVAALLYAVNFLADKIPFVDSFNDFIHTFLRIPAGALLAAGAVGHLDPAIAVAAGMAGGTLATGSHLAKSGTKAVVNASPEPFSNIAVSLVSDVAAIGGVWLAIRNATLFLILLTIVVGLTIWLLPKLLRAVFGLFRRITGRAARVAPGKPWPGRAAGLDRPPGPR